jgi:hypothetical protein
MAHIELSDDDMELLIEALGRLRVDKCDALATSTAGALGFTAQDFGIPKIDALTTRIETAYENN